MIDSARLGLRPREACLAVGKMPLPCIVADTFLESQGADIDNVCLFITVSLYRSLFFLQFYLCQPPLIVHYFHLTLRHLSRHPDHYPLDLILTLIDDDSSGKAQQVDPVMSYNQNDLSSPQKDPNRYNDKHNLSKQFKYKVFFS